MIVVEKDHFFIMIKQHDHAQVSGDLIRHWNDDYFFGRKYKGNVIQATYEHDRGWIDLDNTPFWNDRTQAPYSFIDFPLLPKLTFYRKGVDEVQHMNNYAGLLCSLHYHSFFKHDPPREAFAYLEEEERRQRSIYQQRSLNTEKAKRNVHFHLDLLQFADNISLYICLNEPGTAKEDEWPWYQDGFRQLFSFFDYQRMVADWQDAEHIRINPFPFGSEFTVSVPLKKVLKQDILNKGIVDAYKDTDSENRIVTVKNR